VVQELTKAIGALESVVDRALLTPIDDFHERRLRPLKQSRQKFSETNSELKKKEERYLYALHSILRRFEKAVAGRKQQVGPQFRYTAGMAGSFDLRALAVCGAEHLARTLRSSGRCQRSLYATMTPSKTTARWLRSATKHRSHASTTPLSYSTFAGTMS
jgi:hypothetical protein